MSFCPKCGAPVEDSATFCPKCGTSLQAQPASPLDSKVPSDGRWLIALLLCFFLGCLGIHKAHVSDAHVGFLVAERTRFELVIRVFAYDGLANRWFQPLTHLSGTLFRREIVPIRLD